MNKHAFQDIADHLKALNDSEFNMRNLYKCIGGHACSLFNKRRHIFPECANHIDWMRISTEQARVMFYPRHCYGLNWQSTRVDAIRFLEGVVSGHIVYNGEHWVKSDG